jgi:hypothetical protein
MLTLDSLGNGKHEDIMEVLRGALNEFEQLRFRLLSDEIQPTANGTGH